MDYIVRLLSIDQGFLEVLRKSNVRCCSDNCDRKALVFSNMIICVQLHNEASNFNVHAKTIVNHIHIEFNNTRLKFDNDFDNWLTVYDHKCPVEIIDVGCVTCSWNANNYEYYLKWCSDRNKCTGALQLFQKRDEIDLKKSQYPIEDHHVQIKCANAKITSVKPTSGPWTGGTTVKITVKNHGILATNKTTTVTVAGRRCEDPKVMDNDTIACTVVSGSAKSDAKNGRGPVIVAYSTESTMYTLEPSEQTFRFVDPEIYDAEPVCVRREGGVIVNVTGRFLDAGSSVRLSVGGNVPCRIVTSGPDSVTCSTGPSDGPTAGPVTMEFDTFLTVHSRQIVRYAAVPVLDPGQLIGAVASGGTTISVYGRHLSCATNASMYVVDPVHGNRHYAGCTVENDLCMVCQTPTLHRYSDAAQTTVLDLGFQMYITGDRMVDLSPQPVYPKYSLYPDPVFEYFEIQNESVVIINGREFGQGYRSSDLDIRFQNSTERCVVLLTTRNRIVCEPDAPETVDDLDSVLVTLGLNLRYHMRKKSVDVVDPMRLSSISCGFIVVFIITLFVCVILCGLKKIGKTYTGRSYCLPTELESLDK